MILAISPSILDFNFLKYKDVINRLKEIKLAKLETDGVKMEYLKYATVYNFSKLLFPLFFRYTLLRNSLVK